MDLSSLIAISRRYGRDKDYVLLGGGNTSVKDKDIMYVKASGHALSDIDESGFVRMSLPRLARIWDKTYPADKDEREDAVLADMMACRCEGETARPSVEALLHSLIPFTYIVHLHPALVNGVTCAQAGKASAEALFPQALWIPLVNPGYILAQVVREEMAVYKKVTGTVPQVVLLQNHGIFVGGRSPEQVEAAYDAVMSKLARHITRLPHLDARKPEKAKVAKVLEGLSAFYGKDTPFAVLLNKELETKISDKDSFYPLSSAFTPDHIVYSGFKPLWIGNEIFKARVDTAAAVKASVEAFEQEHGVRPKVIVVQGVAVFAISDKAMDLFTDTIKVAAYTESFGGPRFMDDDQIEFIRTWEVEKYRVSVTT
ncbi:class II aldolase/adducin family protein [Parasphaerochaeta coccoides]|uniref:Class II aldolase/adducin family protein n=1 Tax=Parasphaerochaeta coccoides (strain ATCC BAA-1237 / DSM 17374 / SPN1) TaxID=760011 RepID=F4GKH5_PARC1|nr:class II aldolase/adducin family protein [Parasphaerochaeta coccoides]AEC02858.1 class II aldolase/adducin family protein [Parasphaerochaeta coccoides DSM 17374]